MNLETKERNYGIDALRLLLMLMVVMLHVLGDGGVLEEVKPFTMQYTVAWLMETFCMCAVNAYAIITGYVYINKERKYTSMILLWLQMLIYTLGLLCVAWMLNPQLTYFPDFLDACFPIMRKSYWYVSAYVGVFIFIPFLNTAINALDEQKMKKLVISIFVVFSCLGTLGKNDPFSLDEGYSFIWITLLYIVGACLRKYGWGQTISIWKMWIAYILVNVVSLAIKVIVETYNANLTGEYEIWMTSISYTCPTIVCASIILVLIFSKLQIGNRLKKWVKCWAPCAFGVYLIHKQEYFTGFFIKGKYASYGNDTIGRMIIKIMGTTMVIYLCCILMDKIRCGIFKFLKIRDRIEVMEEKIVNR